MQPTVMSFVLGQWKRLPAPLHADLSGKTVVVVGANSGIGLETAKHFAQMRPERLVIACRSSAKGRTAAEHIARDTGYSAELQPVDLADFASVKAFAAQLKDDPIDILVANAGVVQPEYLTTKDGWEQADTSLQVNHLSTALICLLLLPNMHKAAQVHNSHPRLVTTTSGLHMRVRFGEDLLSTPSLLHTLNSPELCTSERFQVRYHDSKLLNVLFIRALAAHLPATSPLVPACACPGYCVSEIRRNSAFSDKVVYKLLELTFGRTAEQGSRQILYAALGPDGRDGHHVRYMRGVYVAHSVVSEPGDYVISREGVELQERIWRETLDILAETAPEVRRIVNEFC
ncbi:uncharacterized protein PHACADRAFT_185441 [Phanerochaete carnosa HHB-10118-sp]|uniref:NAD(P)-binding protein n=1 Tax=Phanerochaete carnosa (strain HHB-10118-sp) TaxID=650164 RepID=K5VSP4_PHACS|nr:uncharacterized protein PHACADRAFT_185441 [Phanerochaete carnosa HHB-10118-sp]EKM54523.1 hypothetical protein PHACADRAFT_185441 [Phanerochaete carnosa HHB-10118-sp]